MPVQYSHVVGTEQALVAVGDSIGTADGADGLAADQHLFALLVCGVGICAAVHLPEESQQQGEKSCYVHSSHFVWDADQVQPVLAATAQTSAVGPSGESFLQRCPHAAGEEEEEEGRALTVQPLRWSSSVGLSRALLASFNKDSPLVPSSSVLAAPPVHFCLYFFIFNTLITFYSEDQD